MRPKSTMTETPVRHLVRVLGLRTLVRFLGTFVLVLSLGLPLLGLLPACAAPTLPLPPPTALVSTPADDGFVTVSGNARPNALIMILNESRDLGVIVSSDAAGDYTARIEASIAEIITVWQMVGTDTSQLVSREVPNR